MGETALGAFLRARRAGVRPADAGVGGGRRRRTPGLRREEVAARAGISPDYYTRLEQGRQRVPTPAVLDGLAHALLLSDAERAYLHRIADPRPAAGHPAPVPEVSAAARGLLDALAASPAFVVGPRFDVLAWNDLGAALMAGLATRPAHERNLLWQVFCCPHGAAPANREAAGSIGAELVAGLRAQHADHPADPDLARLVARLSAGSPEFAALWSQHRAGAPREGLLRLRDPRLAADALPYTVLALPTPGQHLFVCLPPPGARAPFRALAEAGATG